MAFVHGNRGYASYPSFMYPQSYPFQQVIDEMRRTGKWVEETLTGGVRYMDKDFRATKSRLKRNGIPPQGGDFADILKGSSSPWGKIDNARGYPDEGQGIYSVSTPSHGGLWLSAEWKKRLPKGYEPHTGNKTWAEEDCDAAIVLQAFGLLTLFHEITTMEITQADIDKGYESRRELYGDYFYGGAISEAYKRIYGYDKDLHVTVYDTHRNGSMSKPPGGWQRCSLNAEATAFQRRCDAGESVEPCYLSFEPNIYVPLPLTWKYRYPDNPELQDS